MNNIQVSKHFKLREFASEDNRVKVHPYLIMQVELFREKVAMPVIINRGYISKDRAKAIGLNPNSESIKGKAVDISIRNLKSKYTEDELKAIAKQCNFKNIQIWGGHTMHLEVKAEDRTMNRVMLSKNFSLHEFRCKNGDNECMVHGRLVTTLEKYRAALGNRALVITSAYRTPAHDKKVGGSGRGQHTKGTAVDIRLSSTGRNIDQAYNVANTVGFDGIGKYRGHIHVDTRGSRARWDYR